MGDERTKWTLEFIEKLLDAGIGEKSRLLNIKDGIQDGREVSDDDKEYLKQKFNQFNIQVEPESPKIVSNTMYDKTSQSKTPKENDSDQSKIKIKKPSFSFKKKPQVPLPDEGLLRYDWFFDKVQFRRQSNLAIVIGILTILSSFMVFGVMGMGGSGINTGMLIIAAFISWIIIVMAGAALISLGAREVPRYPTLADAIEDYVKDQIEQSKK